MAMASRCRLTCISCLQPAYASANMFLIKTEEYLGVFGEQSCNVMNKRSKRSCTTSTTTDLI